MPICSAIIGGDRSTLSPSQLIEPDVYSFPEQRELRVAFGSLTEQKVDALVSCDDGFCPCAAVYPIGSMQREVVCERNGTRGTRCAQDEQSSRPRKLWPDLSFTGAMGFSDLEDKVWVRQIAT
jgi:hypothetical protein